MQLELFEAPSTEELKVIKTELSNTRRGLFRRYDELTKLYEKQKRDIEDVRRIVRFGLLSHEYLRRDPRLYREFVSHYDLEHLCSICGNHVAINSDGTYNAICDDCKRG